MRNPARVWLAVCACGALVACRGPTDAILPGDVDVPPTRDTSPVQTDSLSYRLVRRPGEYRAYVVATYRNTTGAPVYFKRCTMEAPLPMFDMGRTGADSTRDFFVDWAWACVGGVPTGVLAPGASVTVRVPFGSVDQPNMQPPLRAEELVGVFRIYLSLCTQYLADSDDCVASPVAERRSNAFLVHY